MRHSRFILLLLAFVAAVGVLTTSCRKSYTVIPTDQLVKMSPFQAAVERVYVEDYQSAEIGTVATVGLKTTDGRRVAIGGDKASAEMVGFVRSLQRGQTYTFPDVYIAYQRSREEKK
jgi:ABC-type Fe3+-hydroxamate transport system substrate-binding protein